MLKLGLNEFSILNVAEMDGLQKYGGSGNFQLKIAREGSDGVWNVTVDSPRLMELLGIFVGERTVKLVRVSTRPMLTQTIDLLWAVKSLIQRVYREQALSAGGRDELKLGRVLGADGLLLLNAVNQAAANASAVPAPPLIDLTARLIAVKPGLVLASESFTLAPSIWATGPVPLPRVWMSFCPN